MRWGVIISASLLLGGCAAHVPSAAEVRLYKPASASALVFDPPVAAHLGPLALSRSEREFSAFVAFDLPEETFYLIRTDDRQTRDFRDRYERRAIIETVGVSRR